MPNPTTYTAITIGPVIETLNLTSKPAGLWAASYLFSELSRQICERLPKDDIVSPYFKSGEHCGAGLFPDRIIMKMNSISLETLNDVISQAKKSVASDFGIDENYLCGYLQVHAVQFKTAGNPIKELSPLIAMMENERYFTTEESENKLLAVIEKKQQNDESACDLVKNCSLVKNKLKDKWPLWADNKQGGKIKSLSRIASNGQVDEVFDEKITSEWKKHRYYAVIQADGDSIGGHITGLESNTEITEFSKKCWNYSKKAAEIAQSYGGVTIYAGGDDLLAIVPIENKECETVFDLIANIRGVFKEIFGSVGSLSFGVAVRFYKYPLYESINAAQSLLFEKAKKVSGKNAIAFNLQKHSGQSIGLLFSSGNENGCLAELKYQIKKISLSAAFDADTLLHSIMSHLRIYESVFATAIDEGKTKQAFENIFGEETQKGHAMIQDAQKLLSYCSSDCDCVSIIEEVAGHDHRLMKLDAMLRLIKFFIEKGEEEDDHV